MSFALHINLHEWMIMRMTVISGRCSRLVTTSCSTWRHLSPSWVEPRTPWRSAWSSRSVGPLTYPSSPRHLITSLSLTALTTLRRSNKSWPYGSNKLNRQVIWGYFIYLLHDDDNTKWAWTFNAGEPTDDPFYRSCKFLQMCCSYQRSYRCS